MNTTELTHILDLVRTMCPNVKWDTEDDGTVILRTYEKLEVK